MKFDRNDPEAWLAIELDTSLPMQVEAKKAWVKDSSTWSRQFLLPLLKPLLHLLIGVIQLYKTVFPNAFTSAKFLHRCLAWGLKTFVTREGNYLLVRHFHLGTQVLEFLKDNIDGVSIETVPLYPKNLEAVRDNLILQHDINLYNFVIDLNLQLKEKNIELKARPQLNFASLHEPPIQVNDFKNGLLNKIDIQTAIEIIIPFFQLLLTDREFWRSTHSLQLDETIGLYYAKILNLHNRLFLVNNRHPLVPVTTSEAGHRLALHSLSTEILHAVLLRLRDGKAI